MKTHLRTLCLTSFCFSTALLLSQCTTRTIETARVATPTPTGNVTVKSLGDATIATRKLIHHPLTNKDIGKVYEEITIVSPRGTSVQERVIVRALPKLETNVVSK